MAPSSPAERNPVPMEAFAGFDARSMFWETKSSNKMSNKMPHNSQVSGTAMLDTTTFQGVDCNSTLVPISHESDCDAGESQGLANVDFDDELDSSSRPSTMSTDSPTLKSAMTAASTSEGSDCDHAVGRWANFEFDDEVDSFPEKADSVAYPSSQDEPFNADWSSQHSASQEDAQNYSPEMHGCYWVPVAVVPWSWPSDTDGSDFAQGHTRVSDLKHVLDARTPAKGPKVSDKLAATWKNGKHQAGRKRAKKQAAVETTASQKSAAQSKGAGTPAHTTIMIRNIPKTCTRALLQSMLDSEGFEGQYDFLYLPFNFDDWSILGHAFVNFLELCDAERAVAGLTDRVLWPDLQDQPSEAIWSKALQGLAPCIGRFRNSPVMHASVADEYKPLMLKSGRRCAFPEPTKQIQPVRRECAESQL